MAELEPPRKSVELQDPGAHELDSSEGEDHFSDASEGDKAEADRNSTTSPIPTTRVEKVDDEPSHGDVPGTAAYEMRQADAVPDMILKAPEGGNEGSPTTSDRSEPLDEVDQAPKPEEQSGETHEASHNDEAGYEASSHDNNDFGDDFDDFEEGGEGDDFGDDFGDFDDGFQNAEGQDGAAFDEPAPPPPVPEPAPSLPQLNLQELNNDDEILASTQPYIEKLFPSPNLDQPVINSDINPSPLSERSLSLWAQLVAPPPLQPPNWVRSRIRRLFLVSLGVPVDLDEILPASKQKKLVLPSISIAGERSPRGSYDERATGAVSKLKKEDNDSTTSVDSSPPKVESKRRGPPPPPELDISSTTMLCSTTDAALNNFTNTELKAHVRTLEELRKRADEVLGYWLRRMESAIGDKEAFEAVIANLVEHAKKVRK
ncbi:uncharacterized protein K452DRAFT_335843 [Aplosporella prunicola CBS 121167]|uniref:Uncharacterized protein n=1 Tax=Aplosporella prunicola CBS 121167 TaxID=1176127 RepID=A0A6A6B799_9PEZI|nr:uncharacterized protein K452DRAFT_335843 [Aplosporella prunicola CBS 121167]KAF2139910.1 hypothetical protein K452DRAFT_335843 [Aplosporella prunicola CBS 121167]